MGLGGALICWCNKRKRLPLWLGCSATSLASLCGRCTTEPRKSFGSKKKALTPDTAFELLGAFCILYIMIGRCAMTNCATDMRFNSTYLRMLMCSHKNAFFLAKVACWRFYVVELLYTAKLMLPRNSCLSNTDGIVCLTDSHPGILAVLRQLCAGVAPHGCSKNLPSGASSQHCW